MLSVYLNSQFSLMQNLDFVIRILVACLCGFVLGVERSRRFKEAGVRTHMIVCAGAALIMIVSKYGFADLTSASKEMYNGTRGADPARLAAQVVSGVGFLGAGMIFKNGGSVTGLTTAAGIVRMPATFPTSLRIRSMPRSFHLAIWQLEGIIERIRSSSSGVT